MYFLEPGATNLVAKLYSQTARQFVQSDRSLNFGKSAFIKYSLYYIGDIKVRINLPEIEYFTVLTYFNYLMVILLGRKYQFFCEI